MTGICVLHTDLNLIIACYIECRLQYRSNMLITFLHVTPKTLTDSPDSAKSTLTTVQYGMIQAFVRCSVRTWYPLEKEYYLHALHRIQTPMPPHNSTHSLTHMHDLAILTFSFTLIQYKFCAHTKSTSIRW